MITASKISGYQKLLAAFGVITVAELVATKHSDLWFSVMTGLIIGIEFFALDQCVLFILRTLKSRRLEPTYTIMLGIILLLSVWALLVQADFVEIGVIFALPFGFLALLVIVLVYSAAKHPPKKR